MKVALGVINGRSPINTSCSLAESICLVLFSVSISYTTNLKFAFKAAEYDKLCLHSMTSNLGFSNLYDMYLVDLSLPSSIGKCLKTLSIPFDKSANCYLMT